MGTYERARGAAGRAAQNAKSPEANSLGHLGGLQMAGLRCTGTDYKGSIGGPQIYQKTLTK